MAGIEEPNTIDLVTYDQKNEEYALIMIESRPWTNTPEQLAQLHEKVNSYALFAIDEGLVRTYPDAAGKPVRIQLDCVESPFGEASELLSMAKENFAKYKIRFVVNVLE